MTAKAPHRKAPRDKRLNPPPPFRMTERDIAILDAVSQYRAMTFEQIRTLVFAHVHPSTPQHRLALLYHHAMLDRHVLLRRGGVMYSPVVYLLARKGAEVLQRKQPSSVPLWTPNSNNLRQFFLEHTLTLADFRLQVTQACHQHRLKLTEWRNEKMLKSSYDYVQIRAGGGGAAKVSVIPDGFIVIETPTGEAAFCVEVDMGTMPLKRFKLKILAYLAYLPSDDYKKRFGQKGARVLTVTPSRQRLKHLKQTAEAAGAKNRFWFAVMNDIRPETVLTDAIWQVAGREQPATLLVLP